MQVHCTFTVFIVELAFVDKGKASLWQPVLAGNIKGKALGFVPCLLAAVWNRVLDHWSDPAGLLCSCNTFIKQDGFLTPVR